MRPHTSVRYHSPRRSYKLIVIFSRTAQIICPLGDARTLEGGSKTRATPAWVIGGCLGGCGGTPATTPPLPATGTVGSVTTGLGVGLGEKVKRWSAAGRRCPHAKANRMPNTRHSPPEINDQSKALGMVYLITARK